ncbi:hypothetical protein Q5P01_006884 [Channa striata]|uniref:Uncharacterized protein n=1 Tax=Channa striata TaxID=64152 RepID=A0AA88SZ79_CHASR|nr:hypothetical protein Q5P01_006884 [Channa striata]
MALPRKSTRVAMKLAGHRGIHKIIRIGNRLSSTHGNWNSVSEGRADLTTVTCIEEYQSKESRLPMLRSSMIHLTAVSTTYGYSNRPPHTALQTPTYLKNWTRFVLSPENFSHLLCFSPSCLTCPHLIGSLK